MTGDPCTYDCDVAEPHGRRERPDCVWRGVPDVAYVDGYALRITDPRLFRLGPLPARPQAFVNLDEARVFGDADGMEDGYAPLAAVERYLAEHRDTPPPLNVTVTACSCAAVHTGRCQPPTYRGAWRSTLSDEPTPGTVEGLRAAVAAHLRHGAAEEPACRHLSDGSCDGRCSCACRACRKTRPAAEPSVPPRSGSRHMDDFDPAPGIAYLEATAPPAPPSEPVPCPDHCTVWPPDAPRRHAVGCRYEGDPHLAPGPSLADTSPALLDALRALGAEYGPTGVARVAAALVADAVARNFRSHP